MAAAVVAGLALGGLVWIAADPEYWFPDAFAEEGPPGDKGLVVSVVRQGRRDLRATPVRAVRTLPRDEALSAVDDVQAQLDDLASRVDNLEDVDVYDLDSRLSDLDSRLSEIESNVDDVCFELDLFC